MSLNKNYEESQRKLMLTENTNIYTLISILL